MLSIIRKGLPSNRRRQTQVIFGLIAALVSNWLVLGAPSAALKLAGGLLLFCLIPGYLWLAGLFPVVRFNGQT